MSQYIEKNKGCVGKCAEKFNYFLILIKFIDAHDSLSVQVHPDDEYAKRVEGEYGKTEMWYVLECEEGASLYYGVNRALTKEEFRSKIEEAGLSHEFMALYLNADNLYPNIRFSPPIYGEYVVNPDGTDGKWYRYWSDKAKDSMIEHLQGLMKCYGKNNTAVEVNGKEMLPICSMWDPIVAPSFDEDGRNRYLSWLENKYGNIENLNNTYKTAYKSFD